MTIGVVIYIYVEYTRIKRDYERMPTQPDDDLELGPETEQRLLAEIGVPFEDASEDRVGKIKAKKLEEAI